MSDENQHIIEDLVRNDKIRVIREGRAPKLFVTNEAAAELGAMDVPVIKMGEFTKEFHDNGDYEYYFGQHDNAVTYAGLVTALPDPEAAAEIIGHAANIPCSPKAKNADIGASAAL